MAVVTTISLVGLTVAGALCIGRLVRPGSSIADRIVALDTLLVVSVIGIAVFGVQSGTEAYTPVLLVTAILAFVGTVTVARFIEQRGAR